MFLRLAEFSNASATSSFEIVPAENFAIASFHISESDFLAHSGRWIVFPLACAHLIISSMDWVPQFRAVERCL